MNANDNAAAGKGEVPGCGQGKSAPCVWGFMSGM